jgi:hypothetical protein
MTNRSFTFGAAARVAAVLLAVTWASVPAVGQMARPRPVAGCPPTAAAFHPCALEKAKAFNPPRTPDGQPDFQGLWEAPMASGLGNIEGRGAAANAEYQTGSPNSLVVDPPGAIPYQPWARMQTRENAEHYIDPYTHCLPITAPRIMASPRTRQIAQYPGYLTIVNESGGHPFRVIYLDGRPHLPADIKLWRGDARGQWEDKTLVIDTTNFNGRAWFGSGGDFFSDALHLTERLTMVDANTLDYAVTIDDPKVVTRPWTMVIALERNQEQGYEQMEEGCFESDRDTAALLLTGFKMYTGPRFPQ